MLLRGELGKGSEEETVWSIFKGQKVGADAGALGSLATEERGRSCLMSSVYLHIKVRLSTESWERKFGGLSRGRVDAIFEEDGRVFQSRTIGLLDGVRSHFRLVFLSVIDQSMLLVTSSSRNLKLRQAQGDWACDWVGGVGAVKENLMC